MNYFILIFMLSFSAFATINDELAKEYDYLKSSLYEDEFEDYIPSKADVVVLEDVESLDEKYFKDEVSTKMSAPLKESNIKKLESTEEIQDLDELYFSDKRKLNK